MAWPLSLKHLSFEIPLALFLLTLSLLLNQFKILQRWDNLFYDLESKAITRQISNDIVIIAIDDISLKKLGRWPWSRAIHAQLLNQLTKVNIKAIGIDILFMEPDLYHPENDIKLARAIRQNGKVVLPVLTHVYNNEYTVIKPLADIALVANLAHVNIIFDSQGVVRHHDLQIDLKDGTTLPSMPLALKQLISDSDQHPISSLPRNILVTFAGPPGQFHQVSYVDVLSDEKTRLGLQGKTILLGTTAAGLANYIATPVSKGHSLMSGIEFQANVLATVLSGHIIQPLNLPKYTLVTCLLIVLPIFLFRFCKPGTALLIPISFSIITCLISFLFFYTLKLWFPPLPTLFCLMLSYPLWSWYKLVRLSHSLFNQHEKASATLKAIGEAVITTDKHDCIKFMNPAAEKLLACNLADVKLKKFTSICRVVEQHKSKLLNIHQSNNNTHQPEPQTIKNNNEMEYVVRISNRPLHDENGLQSGIVYAISDLTEIFNINRKISFIASHDELTGLPNRILLQDRIEQAINSSIREKLNFAILFIDLDGFKKVNDAMGHTFGDLLLKEIATRLRAWARKSDTIARWGGDEFVLLLENLAFPEDAAEVAIKIKQSLSQSYMLNKQEVFITPSIGISLFPDDGQTVETLLAKADSAMYSIKKSGRNNFCFYSLKLENQAKEKLVLEAEIRHALLANEFEVFYQPQLHISSEKLIGAEALIRWRHPKKGLIAPDKFIPLSEDIGLITPIGEWVIKTVCQQLQNWQNQSLPLIKVAINLSAHQFTQKDLVNFITREINSHGIDTKYLQVEITESMMIQDIDKVIKILDSFKSSGISIAIDDFGTGYSSLEYLKRFPIDKLKIDKSFIANVIHSAPDASIVEAVIVLGHSLNMQIIAEGVENEQQAKFLLERKCDYGQGFYYSKPITAYEMGQLIEKFWTMGKI